MKPAFFIVPGFPHKATDEQYAWLRNHVQKLGYEPKLVPVQWRYRTMTDYVHAFREFYDAHRSNKNVILGFSVGAMIAFITAPETNPDRLYLCSLSPYFKEDLPDMEPSWKSHLGKRRVKSFDQFSAQAIAKQINTPTTIFCGEAEAKEYPSLKRRCMNTSSDLKDSHLYFPKDAPHEIDFPSYIQAIKQALS